MKMSDLTIAIMRLYVEREPGMIWGPPGIGKTDGLYQAGRKIAKRLITEKKIKKIEEFGVIDFRLAMRDPTALIGFPMPDQKSQTMKFWRDGELPTSGYGIVFMDEINSATRATQAGGMQLTLTRRIGEYQLPDGWSIMAAGNRESDNGVVYKMPAPLANRLVHIDAEVDNLGWQAWAVDNGVTPELLAWIRFKPDLLFKFDPKIDSKAFPTPRSWVKTDKFLRSDDPETIKYQLIKGTVGDGPGSDYWSFLKLIDQLPTLEEIRLNPTKAKVPTEKQPGARCAVTTLMGANVSEASFEAFLTYAERLEKDFQAVFVRDALKREPKLRTNKVYAKWAIKNHDVIC